MEVYNSDSLIHFANSILKHFNAPTFHESLKSVDEVLKGHKKVAVILFDGMGKNIIEKHLNKNSFIRKNYLCTINSTFPPTTSAATTSLLTGKYPIETGWMAWTQYFDEYQRNIILFNNRDYNTYEEIKPREDNIAMQEMPIKMVGDIIHELDPSVDYIDIRRKPIQPDGPFNLRELRNSISSKLKNSNKCYLYAYFDSPDCEMHERGIDCLKVDLYVKRISYMIHTLVEENPDTLFFTIADHGHINVFFKDFCEHDDLYSLLAKPMSFEKRAPTFFVKEGKCEEFKEKFNQYYGEHFELLTKKEVLDIKLFGEGVPQRRALNFIGDFVAVSKDGCALYASKEIKKMVFLKGNHGGGTKEEREIVVSAYNL